jgi:rhamnogalacturonyl hydrolase YesR
MRVAGDPLLTFATLVVALALQGCASHAATSGAADRSAATSAIPAAGAPHGGAEALAATTSLDARQVSATVARAADWALAHPAPFDPRSWVMAPLYDGLIDASLVTGDPKYLAAVVRAGRRVAWQPGPATYHADDHAAGHAWLRLYLMDPKDPALLEPFESRFEEIVSKPIRQPLSFTSRPSEPGVSRTDRWTWADALYMAPPTVALLAKATGDERYLRFMDAEFKAAYDALFDPQEKLFFRDARFLRQRTSDGHKVFWSRGDGWVYAGLALVIPSLPPNHPTRKFYVEVFRQMTTAVLAAQQNDGFWYPSLQDPQQIPIPETSGSALLLFGLAAGVREGLLDQAAHWPAVERGWKAIATHVADDGAVGYVQPIGASPEWFDTSAHLPYGTGAVLMAGAEILRALGAAKDVEPKALLEKARRLVASAADLSREGAPGASPPASGAADRAFTVGVLTRIAEPVLAAAAKGELRKRLPVHDWEKHRAAWTHYEAFARTLAGIAPWLALGPDEKTPEGRVRARFIDLARQAIVHATDPASPDYLNFGQVPDQPLVEAAYFASALLAAPHQLWDPLDAEQRRHVVEALEMSRRIEPHRNNWILFPAMVEAALWQLAGAANAGPIDAGVYAFQEWYLGDGIYGDGPQFHWDYYNSYAIQPMLLDVLRVAEAKHLSVASFRKDTLERARRYAEILERLISPEGTFPVMGRSSAYRFAAFYHLAYMALHKQLPDSLKPGAVRAAITAVVRRQMEAPGTFDDEGWLQLGSVGAQPGLREEYNATGSLYMCLVGLVHLGLPPEDPLWTAPAAPWTQKRIWAGEDVPHDHALGSKLE